MLWLAFTFTFVAGLAIGGFLGAQWMALYVAGKFWSDEPLSFDKR